MAIHTFLTGIRGVLAPLVAFQAVEVLKPSTLGWIATGLIVAASLMLVPEISLWKPRKSDDDCSTILPE